MENNFKYSKDDVFSGRSGLSYTVISQMKYGPYTEIYKIRRNIDGCPCIMKILRYGDMPGGLMATSSPLIHTYLESSNIAGQFMVYDWGETPDDFYIISRYFAKGVLRSRLNEGSLRPKSAVGIILDLAKALASLEGSTRTEPHTSSAIWISIRTISCMTSMKEANSRPISLTWNTLRLSDRTTG